MPDPDAAIPVLTGAALAQGIAFLYGQAAELLRLRREDKATQHNSLKVPEVFEPLDRAMTPDLTVLDERAHDLRMLLQITQPYTTRPIADLNGADETLRYCLGHIREALEEVYSTRFDFTGERRAPHVRQNIRNIRGSTTGIKIRGATANTSGEVIQQVKTVHHGGELTGIDIDLRR